MEWVNKKYGSFEGLQEASQYNEEEERSTGLLVWVNRQQWMAITQAR